MNKLTFLTLSLFFHFKTSLSSDPFFHTCPSKLCGKVSITYPFRISEQQKDHCGYPGFEISCPNGTTPIINITGNPYIIQQIWYKNQSFQVKNAFFGDLIEYKCKGPIGNLSLDNGIFNFSKNYAQMALFLNCSARVMGEHKDELVGCGALGLYESDVRVKGLERDCGSMISVPFEGKSGRNGSKMEVLERGFVLNWTANNCSACVDSGGECGFDVQTKEPKCFCEDRAHAYHCVVKRKKPLGLIRGVLIAGSAIILLIALLICCYYKNFKLIRLKSLSKSASLEKTSLEVEEGNIYFGVPLFSYRELVEATDNFDFSRELGDGGFGAVYYGKLRDGREVAIKRLYEKSYKRVEQFMNEVQILTCLRHQNLVSLYGCTSHHSKELLLVYEYVSNGTVADHVHGDKAKPTFLPWHVRMRIAIETASALSYLHASDIVHRDVKTNNILLDSNFSVKVADFGLSRFFPNDATHVSTAPQGTPGYLDPEYHQCYQLTTKSDVYSFGVVLIELISSLPAVDMDRDRQEINLSNYAMNRIQRCAFDELVDPKLGFTSDFRVRNMATSVAELAFQCLQHDKEFRPTMEEVFEALKRIGSADYTTTNSQDNLFVRGLKNPDVDSGDYEAQGAQRVDVVVGTRSVELVAKHGPGQSPICVMDTWDSSTSTIESTSK